jgi:hypothetical protein
MTAHVIYHPGSARKRWERLALILVTLAALAFASWLALRMREALTPAEPDAPVDEHTLTIAAPVMTPEAAPPVEPPPMPRARVRRSIPLDATPAVVEPDGYEVLSATELDAISQDRPTLP